MNVTGRLADMRRRAVLTVVVAAVLGPASAAASDLSWSFDVLLDGKDIGYHAFNVREEDGRQVLQTEAKFDVKFLFITAFRYRHENTEAWENDCLLSIDASTNSNGETLNVQGRREEGSFQLENAAGRADLPGCVQTFAYWRPDILQADRLLNSQTGELESVSVVREGSDVVTVGDDRIPADRYRLSAKAGDITLWYAADDQRWLALEAPAKGGRTLRYEPVAIPAAAEVSRLVANGD